MQTAESGETVIFKLGKIIDNSPGQVGVKQIYIQSTGHISIICIDKGNSQDTKASAFNTFLYIMEGSAELVISKSVLFIQTGEGIVLPAHKPYIIKSIKNCRLLMVVIKSGYT